MTTAAWEAHQEANAANDKAWSDVSHFMGEMRGLLSAAVIDSDRVKEIALMLASAIDEAKETEARWDETHEALYEGVA